MKISIIGLGYVGLPLCIRFASAGVKVLGLDIDSKKIDSINSGESYVNHIDSAIIRKLVNEGLLEASTEYHRIIDVDCVLICVPTPLGLHSEPDISYILETGRMIAPYLKASKGSSKKLVVLESTTYPGTTDEDLREVLEKGSGLSAGRDFHLAYSPEREDPGRCDHTVKTIPKVVGGFTPECLARCQALYELAVDVIYPVGSTRVAEAAKLLENIFRSVNIALVNELKILFDRMDIDVWDVIEAAATKPFGFMPFYPGPGLGGHCIPVDPFYLSWKAHEFGIHTRFIELAGEINTQMPEYVVSRITNCLNHSEKSVKGSRILVLGLAYKPNVDDERESPSYRIMDILKDAGAEVQYYDPFVSTIPRKRQHTRWEGYSSVEWNKKTISAFDVVLISTAHEVVKWKELGEWAQCIVDTRNAMANVPADSSKIWKA